MPTLAELLLALLGPDPLARQERRLIASHLCRLVRERGNLARAALPLDEPKS